MNLSCLNLWIDGRYLANLDFDFESKELLSLAAWARKGLLKLYMSEKNVRDTKKIIAEKSKQALNDFHLGGGATLLKQIPQFRGLMAQYNHSAISAHFLNAFATFGADSKLCIVADAEVVEARSIHTVGNISRFLNGMIKGEQVLKEWTENADRFVSENTAAITQFVVHQLYFCRYRASSVETEIEIVDFQIIDATIGKYQRLYVSEDRFIYRVNFAINAIFGFKRLNVATIKYGREEVEYQHHLLQEEIPVEIVFKDSGTQRFGISADIPASIAVIYDEGEYLSLKVHRD